LRGHLCCFEGTSHRASSGSYSLNASPGVKSRQLVRRLGTSSSRHTVKIEKELLICCCLLDKALGGVLFNSLVGANGFPVSTETWVLYSVPLVKTCDLSS